MTYQGIDTAARITAAQAQKCVENGISWVGRYLVPDGYGKALTAQEIAGLREAGLAILLCWEIGGADMKAGAARGARHGAQARQLAEALGVPSGTAIYFAADWSVQSSEMSACVEYMKAAELALGPYQAGVYGGEAICRRMAAEGYRYIWQCVAWTKEFIPQATATQYAWQGSPEAKAMSAALGFYVDLDACNDLRAAGLWLVQSPEPGPAPQPWYAGAMDWAEEAGLITDGRPNDPVTRAELATVLQRYDARMDEKIRRALPADDSFGGLITND